ncbi:hypothetical protein V8C86DRAFT_2581579 [Haematococcus lacustris]
MSTGTRLMRPRASAAAPRQTAAAATRGAGAGPVSQGAKVAADAGFVGATAATSRGRPARSGRATTTAAPLTTASSMVHGMPGVATRSSGRKAAAALASAVVAEGRSSKVAAMTRKATKAAKEPTGAEPVEEPVEAVPSLAHQAVGMVTRSSRAVHSQAAAALPASPALGSRGVTTRRSAAAQECDPPGVPSTRALRAAAPATLRARSKQAPVGGGGRAKTGRYSAAARVVAAAVQRGRGQGRGRGTGPARAAAGAASASAEKKLAGVVGANKTTGLARRGGAGLRSASAPPSTRDRGRVPASLTTPDIKTRIPTSSKRRRSPATTVRKRGRLAVAATPATDKATTPLLISRKRGRPAARSISPGPRQVDETSPTSRPRRATHPPARLSPSAPNLVVRTGLAPRAEQALAPNASVSSVLTSALVASPDSGAAAEGGGPRGGMRGNRLVVPPAETQSGGVQTRRRLAGTGAASAEVAKAMDKGQRPHRSSAGQNRWLHRSDMVLGDEVEEEEEEESGESGEEEHGGRDTPATRARPARTPVSKAPVARGADSAMPSSRSNGRAPAGTTVRKLRSQGGASAEVAATRLQSAEHTTRNLRGASRKPKARMATTKTKVEDSDYDASLSDGDVLSDDDVLDADEDIRPAGQHIGAGRGQRLGTTDHAVPGSSEQAPPANTPLSRANAEGELVSSPTIRRMSGRRAQPLGGGKEDTPAPRSAPSRQSKAVAAAMSSPGAVAPSATRSSQRAVKQTWKVREAEEGEAEVGGAEEGSEEDTVVVNDIE